MKSRQAGLAFIFVTLVLDVLGIGIVIPILPELIATFRNSDLNLTSLTAMVGPILATSMFSRFTAPTTVLELPGALFFSGAALFFNGLLLALAIFRRTRATALAPVAVQAEVSHSRKAV